MDIGKMVRNYPGLKNNNNNNNNMIVNCSNKSTPIKKSNIIRFD